MVAAVIGLSSNGEERVHAVVVVDPGVDPDEVARRANARLEDHQKIRRAMAWPDSELPRTEGTRKLKRAAILHKYADEIDALYRDSRQSS